MKNVKSGHDRPIVCVDAGHYGKTYNRSPVVKDYYESEAMWKYTNYEIEELKKYKIEVWTTRKDQSDNPSLSDRGRMSKGADLFKSNHSNACDSEKVDRPVGIYFVDDDCGYVDEASKEIAKLIAETVREVMQTNDKAQTYCRKSDNDRDKNGRLDDEYYGVLNGAHAVGTPGVIVEHSFHTNTRSTKWLLDDENLKRMAKAEAATIAKWFDVYEENSVKPNPGVPSTGSSENERVMWDYFLDKLGNEYGVAGLMGNIYAESGLRSNNLQNSYESKLGYTDSSYTTDVDNGTYTNFVNDKAGYGLAQWTYWSRKQALYDYAQSVKRSIGDYQMQLDFLYKELSENYKTVMSDLKSATSVLNASNSVLTKFERPAVIIDGTDAEKEATKNKRAGYGQRYYEKYADILDDALVRVSGSGRCETAYAVADKLKKAIGIDKFNTIIIASGDNFADALSGSYLANRRQAPILLFRKGYESKNRDYIVKNLAPGGKVYILGGASVVPQSMEDSLSDFDVERLYGKTRFETNLKILDAAQVGNEEILITSGWNYADSLSASATGLPILMVNTNDNKLTHEQIEFLKSHRDNAVTIIGGTGAVSMELEQAIASVSGYVNRVYGENREATSVYVAMQYFSKPNSVLLTYSRNFPDGLCGGPLAYAMNAPLLLINAGNEGNASTYVSENNITNGAVLGGTAVVPNKVANAVFK